MNEAYISIDHLSKKFDKDFVLKDVNAVLHKGEILGFLGPSGAGKTTTIKILTGQLMPTSGTAEVLGIDCRKIDERIYEQIGIVTDSSGVYERMTVFDNLKYFARILRPNGNAIASAPSGTKSVYSAIVCQMTPSSEYCSLNARGNP